VIEALGPEGTLVNIARGSIIDEAALVAASLPRPSQWHPGVTSRAYQRYASSIRSRMGKAEFLWKQI